MEGSWGFHWCSRAQTHGFHGEASPGSPTPPHRQGTREEPAWSGWAMLVPMLLAWVDACSFARAHESCTCHARASSAHAIERTRARVHPAPRPGDSGQGTCLCTRPGPVRGSTAFMSTRVTAGPAPHSSSSSLRFPRSSGSSCLHNTGLVSASWVSLSLFFAATGASSVSSL